MTLVLTPMPNMNCCFGADLDGFGRGMVDAENYAVEKATGAFFIFFIAARSATAVYVSRHRATPGVCVQLLR